jgi:outer membrane protein W
MKTIVLFLLALLATPLAAADLALGIRHVLAMPVGDTSDLDIAMSRGFGVSAEAFWSERFSTTVAATLVNPEAILMPSAPPGDAVDLGTLGLDVYSLTARWHIAPERRLSAFAGAGGALVQIGNLDDQFGDVFEADFDSETTFVVEGGLRYRLFPSVFLELSAIYLPLETEPRVIVASDPNVALPATLGLDNAIVSIGAAWRF